MRGRSLSSQHSQRKISKKWPSKAYGWRSSACDFKDPYDGEPQIRWAQKYGIKVMCHSGGASIPGSKPITADHLMKLRPDVCGHINGGPTALTDEGVERVVRKSDMWLQVVQAGNLKKTLDIIGLAETTEKLGRGKITNENHQE